MDRRTRNPRSRGRGQRINVEGNAAPGTQDIKAPSKRKSAKRDPLKNSPEDLAKIDGLLFVEDYLTPEKEEELLQVIDDSEWSHALARRTQHYGYCFDYTTKDLNMREFEEFPDWAVELTERLQDEEISAKSFDNIIVNEYKPGQGINTHVDRPCFGETIVSISMGSDAVMEFTHCTTKKKVNIFLPRRSLIALRGDARYKWAHCIPAERVHRVNGRRLKRGVRVSITLRNAK